MSVGIVFNQMLVLLLLMLVGFVCARLGIVNEDGSVVVSNLIGYVFNPALLIANVMVDVKGEDMHLKAATLLFICMFLLFIVLGWLVSRILTKNKAEQSGYQLMMVFSNMGFMGIPMVRALYGEGPLVYISIAALIYNTLLYTYGIKVMGGGEETFFSKESLKRFCNMGTAASVVAVVILLMDIKLPYVLESSISYLGNVATPLALMSVGLSLGKTDLRAFLQDGKMYLFSFIKLVVVPVFCAVLIKALALPLPEELLGVLVIVIGMPVGNMPVVLANQFGKDSERISRTVLVTTVFSVLSLTLVVWIYSNL